MYINWDERENHANKLKIGLKKLGPNFTAILCWWCKGTTVYKYECCDVCGKGCYHNNNGLLWPGSIPASDSVAYQVLNAAEKNHD